MALDKDIVDLMQECYVKGYTYSETQRDIISLKGKKVKYDTIKRYFDKWENGNGKKGNNGKVEKNLNQKRLDVIEAREKDLTNVVEMIKHDKRYTGIADKILDILNDEKVLKQELAKNGVRTLGTLLGILTDKSIKVKDSDIKQRQFELDQDKVSKHVESIQPLYDLLGIKNDRE